MIRTLADFVDRLRAAEEMKLETFSYVDHAPMIGSMYEGLTRDILDRALFADLDLRVVTGKLRDPDGRLSRQLDAMVVVGEGERLPHTPYYIYPLTQVLVVVEVKKTLYGDELADAYVNIQSVGHELDPFALAGDDMAFERASVRRFERAFRLVAQRDLPGDGDLESLGFEREMLAQALLREAVLPVRIVLGYSGYKTEVGLRDGFVNYLEKVVTDGQRAGYGPTNFPNLIACGRHALVKTNGMPYAATHTGMADEWLLYCSVADRPNTLLLEVIWTRLASQFDLPASIFGEDLELERLNPLLFGRPMRRDDRAGWFYREFPMSAEELSGPSVVEWAPMRLTIQEASLLRILGARGAIDTAGPTFGGYIADVGDASARVFLDRVRLEGIAAVDEKGVLRNLTDQCMVVMLPDGSIVAGENSTGRLTRWVNARKAAGDEYGPEGDGMTS
jgi:hypothetical protein